MGSRAPRFACSSARNNWPISATLAPSWCAILVKTARCDRSSQDGHASYPPPGVRLLHRIEAFPERMRVPRSSSQSQDNSPQDGDSGPEEAPLYGASASPPLPDSGMIVFSSSARMLHMNGPARKLIALFGEYHGLASEPIPPILTEFCHDVLAQLQPRVETQSWEEFEMRRTCHMVTPPLLLRGFGVMNSTNQEFRVILTLAPLRASPPESPDQPPDGDTQTNS